MKKRVMRNNIGHIILPFLFLFAVIFMPLTVHAEPTEDCTGDCPHEAMIGNMHYDTLVDAVDAAKDGDTIELLKNVVLSKLSGNRTGDSSTSDTDGILRFDQAGTYTILGNGHTISRSEEKTYAYKNVIFAKDGAVVNLGKENEPEKSRLVIDGKEQYSTNALLIAHDKGTINMYDGVTVCNSRGHGGTGAAGIVVYGTFNMYGGVVENNQSKMMGGGISLPPWQTEATAVLNVYGGTFRKNQTTGEWGNDFGGAIANFNGKSVYLENAVFEENRALFGGAIYSGTSLEMKDCHFVNNEAKEGGGALYATGSITAKGSFFTENKAKRGGAIGLYKCDLTVDDQSVIYKNSATEAGDDMTIDNEKAHTVKLPTGKSMTATGKMAPFRATGWFEDGRQGTRYDAKTHAEEATKLDYQQETWLADLKVVYKEAYTITYVLNDGSFEEGYKAPSSYEAGDTTQLPTADKLSRNGYRFEGWYDNPNFEGAPITEIGPEMRGDLVFYAKWSKNPTPNPDPEPKPNPDPKPDPEPKPNPDSKPNPEPKPNPDSKPTPVPKPESKPSKTKQPEKAKPPKAPKTGDETTLLLSGATVFACGVGVIVLEKKKKWAK